MRSSPPPSLHTWHMASAPQCLQPRKIAACQQRRDGPTGGVRARARTPLAHAHNPARHTHAHTPTHRRTLSYTCPTRIRTRPGPLLRPPCFGFKASPLPVPAIFVRGSSHEPHDGLDKPQRGRGGGCRSGSAGQTHERLDDGRRRYVDAAIGWPGGGPGTQARRRLGRGIALGSQEKGV